MLDPNPAGQELLHQAFFLRFDPFQLTPQSLEFRVQRGENFGDTGLLENIGGKKYLPSLDW